MTTIAGQTTDAQTQIEVVGGCPRPARARLRRCATYGLPGAAQSVSARTMRQIKALIVTAPDALRQRLRGLSEPLVRAIAPRPTPPPRHRP